MGSRHSLDSYMEGMALPDTTVQGATSLLVIQQNYRDRELLPQINFSLDQNKTNHTKQKETT